jgi:hypothetical protein
MPRPARPWYRTYSEILDSSKAFALGRAQPDLYFDWTMLLALANVTRPRGYLPPDIADICFALRKSPQETAETLSALQLHKFIDVKGKKLYMHKWHEWNPDSDANLTPARTNRSHRNAVGTRNERATTAVGTPRERLDKEEEEDTDQDKERDKDEEQDAPARRNIFVLYDNFMGKPAITPTMKELLIEAEGTYAPECITHCFDLAAAASDGRRSWSFVESFLKRHLTEGCNGKPNSTQRLPAGRGGSANDSDAVLDSWDRVLQG